jgi:hypothetical protein
MYSELWDLIRDEAEAIEGYFKVLRECEEKAELIPVTNVLKEIERLRSLARYNEASALHHAAQEEAKKWKSLIAEKDAQFKEKDAQAKEKDAKINKLILINKNLTAQLKRNKL